jgi:hypothetical protein
VSYLQRNVKHLGTNNAVLNPLRQARTSIVPSVSTDVGHFRVRFRVKATTRNMATDAATPMIGFLKFWVFFGI